MHLHCRLMLLTAVRKLDNWLTQAHTLQEATAYKLTALLQVCTADPSYTWIPHWMICSCIFPPTLSMHLTDVYTISYSELVSSDCDFQSCNTIMAQVNSVSKELIAPIIRNIVQICRSLQIHADVTGGVNLRSDVFVLSN
jgi:hypothetical protein